MSKVHAPDPATARILAVGFTAEQIAECRVALRCIERDRWRDKDVPPVEIEAVLTAWRRQRYQRAIPFFVRDTPDRQLVLL